MKNILIVGFGAMGCRHAQSILKPTKYANVSVLEPDNDSFQLGLERIGCSERDITRRFKTIQEIKIEFDFAVIATSSSPRFQIIKTLISKGVKKFLLEKMVFQSLQQFDEAIELLKKNNATAHCNFVNRYFPNYRALKNHFEKTKPSKFKMNVNGGDFGLGCNAIHYLDLFEYITSSNVKIIDALLFKSDNLNRRGAQYFEFSGGIKGKDERGNSITITSISKSDSPVFVTYNIDDEIYQFSESDLHEFQFLNDRITNNKFNIIPTSLLTEQLIDDIYKDSSLLTTVQQTKNAHQELFKIFNLALGIKHKNKAICPVT